MSHLQSLNIHKQDPLILTDVMSYVFQMISVERVTEYTDLKKEEPWEHMPPCLLREGKIVFDNVNFRHSSYGRLILKDLRACIDSGQKVCLSHLPL